MSTTLNFEELLRAWGLASFATCDEIQASVYRIVLVGGRQVALKALGPHTEEAIRRLTFEYDVLHHVEQQGLAVAVPLLADDGRPYTVSENHIYRLSNWLQNQPAEVRTDEERDRLWRNYGTAIARFHLALASYKDKDVLSRTWQTNLQKRVLDQAVPVVLNHLDQEQLTSFKALLAEVQPTMMSLYADLPLQFIIWDCHPGNIAVDGFEVSGFIDCEHMQFAPRIFDLAYFLVQLIKFDIGDERKEVSWLAQSRQLVVGYESVSELSAHERGALFYAMAGIPLIFIDFFFYAGTPDLTATEIKAFDWLVRHRQEILAKLKP